MRSSPQLRMRQRRSALGPRALSSGLLRSVYAQIALAVALTLLINSMLITGLRYSHQNVPVDRYVSRNASPMPQALREDAMQLFITRDGVLYFRNAKVSRSYLPEVIRQSLQSGSPRRVFFVVDGRAKYWDVSQALDQVREAGVWDVAFLAEVRSIHR
jgi:biopolymer transport protein ExbD